MFTQTGGFECFHSKNVWISSFEKVSLQKGFDQHLWKLSFPLCEETKKSFNCTYHNSCSMMDLNGSVITTAPWDFLYLYFERRLSKEFGLGKQDYASSLPLLSFRTTAFALSDYFSFCNFSPAENYWEASHMSHQWFEQRKNMVNARATEQ